MKTKKIYNPPITEMVEVEFEGGFMKASVEEVVDDTTKNQVVAGDQEVEGEYEFGQDAWQ